MPPAPSPGPGEVARAFAAYGAAIRFADLPPAVQAEAPRAFLNWMGCVLGGCREASVDAAIAALAGSGDQATVIGRLQRAEAGTAAFLNCLSSSVLSFDDTHLATVTHPTGPVAAALFAEAERRPVRGEDFLAALVLGIELQCRLSNALLLPPALANLGLFITGITGPVGAAAALARLLGLEERRMGWAIGLGAAQGAGLRSTHGSMAASFVPATAARAGVFAAGLAAAGFTCTGTMLDGANGLTGVFAPGADPGHASEGLGTRFEMLANTYKPYPAGIVVHPVIDACLGIVDRLPEGAAIAAVRLRVNPLALTLTARRTPANTLEAQISLFHWAAAVLLRRTAGPALLAQDCIDDPLVAALRGAIEVDGDEGLARDGAFAVVTLQDGTCLRESVVHARGSLSRRLTDTELDAKFTGQAVPVLGQARADRLLAICRGLAASPDVGRDAASCWH